MGSRQNTYDSEIININRPRHLCTSKQTFLRNQQLPVLKIQPMTTEVKVFWTEIEMVSL
jgi:hypothetical protein